MVHPSILASLHHRSSLNIIIFKTGVAKRSRFVKTGLRGYMWRGDIERTWGDYLVLLSVLGGRGLPAEARALAGVLVLPPD